jgi:thiol:disulfide interchange protein
MNSIVVFFQKIISFTIAFFWLFGSAQLYAQGSGPQIKHPAKWSYSIKKTNDTEYDLIMKVVIEADWHLYSSVQEFKEGEGPSAAIFTFNTDKKNYQLNGKLNESKAIKEKDDIFEVNVRYFKNEATFVQKIKRLSGNPFKITGTISYQVCKESCIPEEEQLDFKFDKADLASLADTSTAHTIVTADTVLIDSTKGHQVNSTSNTIIVATAPVTVEEQTSLGIFIAGFIGGLLALLTPCVFPMIPLTVSFFTKSSKDRKKGIINAIIYGLSIIVLYVSLGLIITFALGPDALNALASNVFMNLLFFVIFVVFAISFLGAFEITLPASWINKADSASDKGGLLGIFFMAFTLSLVSFSCTGPIIGSLLVAAAVGGNVLNPTLGMIGFSSALALPFALFAAFPGWLNSLPKSGGWLNSVKVVLGLLELALALKFLSNVDLAYHWGILKREVFLALWIVIFTVLGLYLLGKIKFSHDSDLKHVSIPRILFAILTFSFVIYLFPGMWGAPLKLISGFPPPVFYNEGWGPSNNIAANEKIIEGTDPQHCPHNLSCFHDYNKALAYAKQVNKPLMVDFTGWSCVNCRKMEEKVWIDEAVLSRLRNDYVLVSLYVDDKTELPIEEQKISATTGRKIKTIGNKWSDLQTERFKTNSQPWYVLLDHNEMELVSPIGYTPSIDDYVMYLDVGKAEFLKRK